jgi:hypothetical protein
VDLHGTAVYDPSGNRSALKLNSIRGTGSADPGFYGLGQQLGGVLYGLGLGIDEMQTSTLTVMLLCALTSTPARLPACLPVCLPLASIGWCRSTSISPCLSAELRLLPHNGVCCVAPAHMAMLYQHGIIPAARSASTSGNSIDKILFAGSGPPLGDVNGTYVPFLRSRYCVQQLSRRDLSIQLLVQFPVVTVATTASAFNWRV